MTAARVILARGVAVCLFVGAGVKATESPALQALALGDSHYARRAEGARGGTALPGPAEAAIAAYRRALAADPGSLVARCRLMRALFFRAAFCPTSSDERRKLLDEARHVGDRAVQQLERQAPSRTAEARLAALRSIPAAADSYFWTAVSWGEWALARGKLQAARQGAGGRIRDLAQTVIDLDPALEQGGGYRVLGRLHDQAPRIPLLSGWVSRRKALESLDKALERGPDNTVNQLFLAEAILDHAPARRDEARALLLRCASAVPRPEYLVEDARYAELARQRLRGMD